MVPILLRANLHSSVVPALLCCTNQFSFPGRIAVLSKVLRLTDMHSVLWHLFLDTQSLGNSKIALIPNSSHMDAFKQPFWHHI